MATATMKQPDLRKASMRDLILYGFSGFSGNISFIFIGAYLSFYYTDIFGVSPAVVSSLMLFSKVIDGVVDPFIGALSESTRSRWGRFRPWVMFGAPIFGLTVFLMFSSPDLSESMKVVWVWVTYVVYIIASSAVLIPSNSQANIITNDPQQRSLMQTIKQGMGVVPNFMSALALPIVAALGDGRVGWARYGAIMGVMICVLFWLTVVGTKECDTIERLPVEQRECPKVSPAEVVKSVLSAFKSREFVKFTLAFGTFFCAMTCINTMNMYYFTYVLGHKEWVAATSTIALIGSLVGIMCLPVLTRLLGKKRVAQLSLIVCAVVCVVFYLLKSPSLTLVTVLLVVWRFFLQGCVTCFWAMVSDVVDASEVETGQRADGVMQGTCQLLNQVGQAVGGAAPIAIIGAAGYVANQEQVAEVVSAISGSTWLLPLALYALSFVFVTCYKITDEVATQNSLELERRHNSK